MFDNDCDYTERLLTIVRDGHKIDGKRYSGNDIRTKTTEAKKKMLDLFDLNQCAQDEHYRMLGEAACKFAHISLDRYPGLGETERRKRAQEWQKMGALVGSFIGRLMEESKPNPKPKP
jgi:hypothetical protein